MKIIGEKINGTRKTVKQAVLDRDTEFIQKLARSQAEAGATWIDVNAGTPTDREPDDLVWLVHTVQEAVEAPLCLDSGNSAALAAALPEARRAPLINSISWSSTASAGRPAARPLPLLPHHLRRAGFPRRQHVISEVI